MKSPSKKVNAKSTDRVVRVAHETLASRLDAVQYYLPKAAHEWKRDVEHIHQLRVWTRRAQAAVDIYRPLLPPKMSQWVRKALKRIRKSTNQARDDDVFLLRLDRAEVNSSLDALVARVAEHRRKVQREYRDVFSAYSQNDEFGRQCEKLLNGIRIRDKSCVDCKPTLRDWAADTLPPVISEWRAQADQDFSDIEAMHSFRIAGKRLRYTLELLVAAVPKGDCKQLSRMLADLQERLGQINDHAAAIDLLSRWLADAEGVTERFLRKSRKQERSALICERDEFVDWWTKRRRAKCQQVCDDVIDHLTTRR